MLKFLSRNLVQYKAFQFIDRFIFLIRNVVLICKLSPPFLKQAKKFDAFISELFPRLNGLDLQFLHVRRLLLDDRRPLIDYLPLHLVDLCL